MSSITPPRPARVLIVDDSAVTRSLLRSVISSDRRLEVAGTASDGASALHAIVSHRPDLILLDVDMPGMDGLRTLKQMKAMGSKIPVIMCSALTQRGARVTIEALANGASDYVAKPSGQPSRAAAVQTLANDLIPKILALTEHAGSPVIQSSQPHTPNVPLRSALPAVLLIGASTGGPAALEALLSALPASFPLPVLIVQHMPELFTRLLAERLDSRCQLRVREAASGEPVQRGIVYIARGGWHMEIAVTSVSRPPIIRLTQEAPEHFCRPSVDVLFRSAASVYGAGALAVILTGMGSDGLAGSRLIRAHNGVVLAQDRHTSAVWGMPGVVTQAGLAQRVLPLEAIAPEILHLAGIGQHEAIEPRESIA
jgi:two-component system, chemotaxis family, protein-glutamate methylesterase/glutaminase